MKEYKSIYFVGAGGIGMAALERYCLSKGKNVAGYDRTPTALTEALEKEGVNISFSDDVATIPDFCRDKQDTLVVYTPAIPDTNAILSYFRDNGFEVVKRARLLGLVTRDSRGLCFSGTHGKTTTSSMAAHGAAPNSVFPATNHVRASSFVSGLVNAGLIFSRAEAKLG